MIMNWNNKKELFVSWRNVIFWELAIAIQSAHPLSCSAAHHLSCSAALLISPLMVLLFCVLFAYYLRSFSVTSYFASEEKTPWRTAEVETIYVIVVGWVPCLLVILNLPLFICWSCCISISFTPPTSGLCVSPILLPTFTVLLKLTVFKSLLLLKLVSMLI